MDCQLIRAELVAYHFGSVDERTRDEVEAHLLECRGCLESFLALKREIETAQAGPRPSTAARARLRQAVAAEIGKGAAREPAWWRRPLAFGFAAAATAAAMITVVSIRSQLHHIADLAEQAQAVQAPAPRQ